MRARRLVGGAGDAARGPRGLLPRRGPGVARPPRGRASRSPGRTWAASSRSAPGSRSRRWRRPGSSGADVFIASTDGDNTNIVIAQIAKRRFKVPTVIARILDPLRAEWYERQGLNTVCPTRVAIEMLEDEVREAGEPRRRHPTTRRRAA